MQVSHWTEVLVEHRLTSFKMFQMLVSSSRLTQSVSFSIASSSFLLFIQYQPGCRYKAPAVLTVDGNYRLKQCSCMPLALAADIIVDPFFRDAFVQQPSTATYDALLDSLPRAFVGTAAELRKLVALLAAEGNRAYTEKVSCGAATMYAAT